MLALAQAAPAAQESLRPAAEGEIEQLARETRIRLSFVNVRPLRDVLADAGELIAGGRVGMHSRVDVTAKGQLDEYGLLKPETVELSWTKASDEVAASLAQRFVAALGQSKLFSVLEGAKEVTVRVGIDETDALFTVAADLPEPGRAKRLADGYGGLLVIASRNKEGAPEGELYRSVKVSSDGNRFAFTFEMPKEELGRIIADVLAKRAAEQETN